jgi:hypothetical protein
MLLVEQLFLLSKGAIGSFIGHEAGTGSTVHSYRPASARNHPLADAADEYRRRLSLAGTIRRAHPPHLLHRLL